MATKRATPRKTSGKGKTRSQYKKLLAKARAEIEGLLANQKAGTLAQVEMKARLEEIKGHLKELEPFDVYYPP